MKKILKLPKNICLKLLIMILMISNIMTYHSINVDAASHNVSSSFIPGWTIYDGDGSGMYGQPDKITVDGQIAWCLQADKVVSNGPNEDINFSDIGISDNTRYKLSLITNFGYFTQPNDTNYVLTQNLIWRELGYGSYYYSSTYPNLVSMQSWFDDILNKVNSYERVTSWHNTKHTIKAGETLTFTDTNGVLSSMQIVSTNGLQASINGNTLTVTGTINAKDNSRIALKKPISNEGINFVVRNGNSQVVSVCKTEDPRNSWIDFEVLKVGHLEITKINEIGELLDGAVFNLKSITPGINYDQDIVVKDGRIKVENLIIGDYILTEVTAPDHHVITTSYQVTIKPNETTERIVVNRIKPTGKLVINKSFEEVSDIKDVDLSNVRFEVIAKRDVYDNITLQKVYSAGEIVSTLSLDETGQSILEDIPMGEYVVKEVSTLPEYILDTREYDVVFRQEDYVTKEYIRTLNLENKLLLTDIQVKKVDAQTKRTIVSKDFQFGLYSDEACTNLISTMNADRKTGTATFKDIRFGTYYIKEISAPRGYMLSDEVIKVVVDENLENVGTTYTIEYQNTMMPIIVNTGDNTIDSSVFMILAVFSFIVVMLIKKRSFQKMDDAKKEIDTDESNYYKKE